MRASVLFLFNFLVFLALAGLVAAKMMGYFDKPEPPPALEPPEIVAAARRLPEGVAIDSQYATTRPMTRVEYEDSLANPDDYLPATVASVAGRVTARTLDPGEAILRKDLVDEAPERLRERLAPGTRPVGVIVPKERSQGGLIQPGDWVDVSLTTTVVDPLDEDVESIRTAIIARGVRVIMKRNSLLPLYRGMPDDEPIPFTLEANPYRAALISYASSKGELTLSAVSAVEQEELDRARDAVIEQAAEGDPAAAIAGADDADAELIAKVESGSYSISDDDLVAIFGLPPIEIPPPPAIPEPPVRIQRYNGVDRRTDVVFYDPRDPVTDSSSAVNGTFAEYAGGENGDGDMDRILSAMSGESDQSANSTGSTRTPTYRFRSPQLGRSSANNGNEFQQYLEQNPGVFNPSVRLTPETRIE